MDRIAFIRPLEQDPWYPSGSSISVDIGAFNASFPGTNLLTYDPTQVAVSTGQDLRFTIDLGATRLFHSVSLLFTSLTLQSQWVVEGSTNGSSWSYMAITSATWACYQGGANPSLSFTEPNDPRRFGVERNPTFIFNTAGWNYRYIRITLSELGASTMSFGRLMIGRMFIPSKGYSYGSAMTFTETGNTERTDKGVMLVDEGRSIVGASMKLEYATKSEMYGELYDLNYFRKNTKEVLVCLNLDDTINLNRNLIYGLLRDGRSVVNDAFNTYSQTISIESL